jgi:hypothetical protein
MPSTTRLALASVGCALAGLFVTPGADLIARQQAAPAAPAAQAPAGQASTTPPGPPAPTAAQVAAQAAAVADRQDMMNKLGIKA